MKLLTKSKVILSSLTLLVLLSCGTKQQDSTSKKNILYLNLGGEPTYLNPILSTDAPSSSVEGLIFSGLFRINANLELEPDLIESYVVKKSGTHYVFKLKQNILWHDGSQLTAHDVKFTFDKILDKTTNTVRRSNFVIDREPIQFNVLDDFTIEAILPKPFAPFLMRMTMGILPKHLLINEDINKSAFNRSPIGSGPYRFKSWKSAQHIYLERNETYHFNAPKTKTIFFKIRVQFAF